MSRQIKRRSSSRDLSAQDTEKLRLLEEEELEKKSLTKQKEALSKFNIYYKCMDIRDDDYSAKIQFLSSNLKNSFEEFDDELENEKDLSLFH